MLFIPPANTSFTDNATAKAFANTPAASIPRKTIKDVYNFISCLIVMWVIISSFILYL